YGSFGAYVLSSQHISDYLINRAKNVIYATAPSLYDTALAHHALEYIQTHVQELKASISLRQSIVREVLGIECAGLIVPIEIGDNRQVMQWQTWFRENLGMQVGAIRQPTVKRAIIRLIIRLDIEESVLRSACERFRAIWVK
ncbi:MAG: pyridoxal phosphate-dependent aminotransferase family protein, partial [Sulfuricurvum sp.]|nr:pyridoxal phosphate-dependent aminotransferase family protein [Sulfuricurvum sp.]